MEGTVHTPYLLNQGTNRLLAVIMIINGYFTYDGKLVSLEESGGGVIDAILYSTVVTTIIFAFWGWAFRTIPKQRSVPKLIAASAFVAAFSCLAIPHMSALPNLMSFVAAPAGTLHLKKAVSTSTERLDEVSRNAGALQGLVPILDGESELYLNREQLEKAFGEYTGVPGPKGGAVSNSLREVGLRLGNLAEAIKNDGVRAGELIDEAQELLNDMREVVRSDIGVSEKMVAVSKLTDRFRVVINKIDDRGAILLVQHTLESLSGEVLLRRNLSSRAAVANKQQEAFSRIETELAETAAKFTEHTEALLSRPTIEVPAVEVMNAEDLTLAYWDHFTGQAVAAVSIDIAPGILLVLVMISVWGRTEEEEANDEILDMSVRKIKKAQHAAVVASEALNDLKTLGNVYAGSLGKPDVDLKMLGSTIADHRKSATSSGNNKRPPVTKVVKIEDEDHA
jgi:hypothetical protein